MKERGMLFSGPMVRALLDGNKTQTRRVVKPDDSGRVKKSGKSWHLDDPQAILACPYGMPGDRIWVRERWRTYGALDHMKLTMIPPGTTIEYLARGFKSQGNASLDGMGKWRSSLFIPRWASRLSLEITHTRVERLQDISESDAKSEGTDKEFRQVIPVGGKPEGCTKPYFMPDSYQAGYANYWDEINKNPGKGWDANPFVWVIKFKGINNQGNSNENNVGKGTQEIF